MLEHGGKLIEASHKYNIPLTDWLDLSTGINPEPWPVETIKGEIWKFLYARLPEEHDGLYEAARNYYGAKYLLPVAGSQAAIQALPRLRQKGSRIAILNPAYAEHKYAWQQAGFAVTSFEAREVEEAVDHHDVVVLINPNNPTGQRFSPDDNLRWHRKLAKRDGWLVIDEAFMDTTPEQSLVRATDRAGLIIYRSLGKFFGLAGARVGFIFAQKPMLDILADRLGPWTIAAPSRAIAKLALSDHPWQQAARPRLTLKGTRLKHMLTQSGLTPSGGTDLFQWVQTGDAEVLHEHLAKQAILTRLFQEPVSLRFGLPGSEREWARLEEALVRS